MVNVYIEEWQDKGLLKDYFGILAKNIYNRTRVKNSEILELLIYGAYIEEQSKLQETELNIFKEDMNYYYEQGQNEVIQTQKSKKKASVIPDAIFLALLDRALYNGLTYKQQIQATIQYNAQQIYRQAMICLQQQKELEIANNEFQKIIQQQNRQKLNINGDKISGSTDLALIGLNNQAKAEGIQSQDNNARVKFIAVKDGKETDMCHSLDGQIFYINKENEFNRYYGEIQAELRIQKIKCFGLVQGLNLPPISHHWHWCRSTITYQVPPVEKTTNKEYNLDIPKINKDIEQLLKDTKLNNKVRKLFDRYLTKDNTEIDNNLDVVMRYNIEKDKILINPKHEDFEYYDLSESLTHEIIHLIDIRNNISNNLNISNELRRAEFSINSQDKKYIELLSSSQYENNMTLGDIFSAITNGKIKGNIAHNTEYWLRDITRREKEISANVMSAYLNNNKETLDILNSEKSLKEIKDKVVEKYDKYTK